ncbi:MAG: dienelactone hydrolase family protein [Deinococcota bacterium]
MTINTSPHTANNPHAQQPVRQLGTPLQAAKRAVILLHGRGANAADILGLSEYLEVEDTCFIAPEAYGRQWYPQRFTVPTTQNEPFLTSALTLVDNLVKHVLAAGIPAEKLVLGGFSQGACLALEYAARNPRPYGAVVALSGGLIGETLDTNRYGQDMAGMTVFLGCSDVDPHIPLTRVQESTALFKQAGATVTERIYPGMPHTINEDELNWVRERLADIS